MHEVVTLQLGNRANYLATHFWNTQESYFSYPTPTNPNPEPSLVDHDIHFRPGIGADGSDTYTPRNLVYDFQANFGGLRKLNALYDALKPDEAVRGLWDGIQQTQILPPIPQITYQINLESGLPTPQLYSHDIRYWSDYNRLFYHPRSIIPLSSQSFSSTLNASNSHSNGIDLFKDIDREADLLDRDIRPFAEECDSLSSFQVFCSVDDSWGGYASSYIEAIHEEYGKKGIWVWATEDGRRAERAKQFQRLANSALSLRAMTQYASAYIRLSSVPASLSGYVQLEPGSDWSTAALMCAAVESVTLPARRRNTGGEMGVTTSMFEDMLNTDGNQNIWTLQARARGADLAAPSFNSTNTNTTNNNHTASTTDSRIRQPTTSSSEPTEAELEPSTFDIDFTPTLPIPQTTFPSLRTPTTTSQTHIFAQIESHRHYNQSQILTHTSLHPDKLQHLLSTSSPIVQTYHTALPFPLLDSYPSTLFDLPTRNHGVLVDASLSTTSRTKGEVLGLRDLVVGRVGRGLGLVDSEDVEGLYDELTGIAGGYGFGWEGSSDEEGEED